MTLELLIVDDHSDYVKRLMELIVGKPSSLLISTATDYDSAVGSLDAKNFHIVLLDVSMPERNGIDVLRYMREKQMTNRTRIIMVTNHIFDNYRKLCLELGADYFLDKSNDFEMIPSVIETISSEIRK